MQRTTSNVGLKEWWWWKQHQIEERARFRCIIGIHKMVRFAEYVKPDGSTLKLRAGPNNRKSFYECTQCGTKRSDTLFRALRDWN